jgi:putative ABC transport system permease protein
MSFLLDNPKTLASIVFSVLVLGGSLTALVLNPKLFLLILKNLRRNVLRTVLTSLVIMLLVLMVTGIVTVLDGMDRFTAEKAKNLKLILTTRYQVPSMMPYSYVGYLDPGSPGSILRHKEIGPDDFMSWCFYGGTLDPNNKTLESMVFFFVMEPRQILPMMDDLEELDPALVKKLEETKNGCLMGQERMRKMNRQVGERFKVTSINYIGIDLEFEIVGALPQGRYDKLGIMRADYFNDALDDYAKKNKSPHPLDDKRVNLLWLRVPDRAMFDRVAQEIESASVLQNPPLKCETASSGVASFLDPYRSLLWGMKWVLVPMILGIMVLVVANSISISVRERHTEMAVLKVLGFQPRQVAALVIGEALLVGGLSGFAAAAFTYWYLNGWFGGIPFQVGFIPVFKVPIEALAWGLTMGFGVGLLGCIFPAFSARSVKVAEVFSKIT